VIRGGAFAQQEAGVVDGIFRLCAAQDVEHGDGRSGVGDTQHVEVTVTGACDMLLEACLPGREVGAPGRTGTAAREQCRRQQSGQRHVEEVHGPDLVG